MQDQKNRGVSLQRKAFRLIKWISADAFIIVAAYIATLSIRLVSINVFAYSSALPFIAIAVAITLAWLYVFRAYHRAWGHTSGHSATTLLSAVIIAGAIISLLNILITPQPLPLSVIVVSNMLVLSGIVAIRYRTRLITGINWRWRVLFFNEFPRDKSNRVLIVGAGESGQTLAWRLKHRFNTQQYKTIGFIDDDPKKLGMYFEDIPVLGNRFAIPEIVENREIDLIVVAIHNIEGADFRTILSLCEQTQARIKVVPDILLFLGKTNNLDPLRDVLPEDLIGRSVVERHSAVDLSPVMQKSILVTGAAGSIGSELSRQLTAYKPQKLILLDSNESSLHDLYIGLKAKHRDLKLIHILADITDQARIERIFKQYRPQVVFHAAAYKHVPLLEKFPEEAVRINIGGTLNVVDCAHRYHVERFVLISTDKAVNPSSVMGASKQICEHIVHAYSQHIKEKTLFTAVRFGNVLGSRGSVVPTFNQQISHGGPVTITHSEMTRYFMSIPEAANLVIHAACLTEGDEIFLLRMGEKVRILDIAERMIRLRGLRPYIDIPIVFTGVRPGEKMDEELHNDMEKPCETLHPHIFKLNDKKTYADGHYILANIRRLLEVGFDEDRTPLETLLNVTEVNYNTSSQRT